MLEGRGLEGAEPWGSLTDVEGGDSEGLAVRVCKFYVDALAGKWRVLN